jgi:ubiquinone/menaquinone biosynthesis C-methylase UbiE
MPSPGLDQVRRYWDRYVSGLKVEGQPWGSPGFFEVVKRAHDPAYAFSTRLLDLPDHSGQDVLEVGCGMGLDVVEYLRHGLHVAAVDVSRRSLELTRRLLDQRGMRARLLMADAERLPFPEESFDLVVARGVLMYTPDEIRAVREIYRVLKPGGRFLAILHNRRSWFVTLARLSGTNLYNEQEDPPINRVHSRRQVRRLFSDFDGLRIDFDKYPAPSDRRHGPFARLYNHLFVPLVGLLPRALVRPLGYYLIVQGRKPNRKER